MSIIRGESMNIHDFRCFKDISFKLGKKITVIAGHNATGKSTVLGLLGHCAELKKKDGSPIIRPLFRTEFNEIIKASKEFDKRCTNAYTINFKEGENQFSISFRTTWQKDSRFRIIPKKTPSRNTEKKLEWPTLYLGLSRLYPIGESEKANTSNSRLSNAQKEKFFQDYKAILSLNEEPIDCSDITIKETTKKKTVGIRTETYDAFCNSAGQDNLSQILLSVMSFEVLKQQQGDNWKGGLLIIDELDATLHPAAQNKLLDYLYKAAKNIGIQIVFTTHSLSLLEQVCKKIEHNSSDFNNYELVYFTTRNKILELLQNPNFDIIYYDMLNTLSILPSESRKVTVYTEDEEARWLLRKLIEPYAPRIKLPQISLGYKELLKLLKGDYEHFCNIIFVLDGDVPQEEIDELINLFECNNVLKLPLHGLSPEESFFTYLKDLPHNHDVLRELASTGFSLRIVDERGPDSFTEYEKKRDRYKEWFNIFNPILENVYPYWEMEHRNSTNEFIDSFISSFNIIAKRLGIPKIEKL